MSFGKIARYSSFTEEERIDLHSFGFLASRAGLPLSGYLAGKPFGGASVCLLEQEWERIFSVKHAIAVNSATSGLLAAAFACDLKAGDRFACPAMTMSATAAAPCFTGAEPFFVDAEDELFGLNLNGGLPEDTKAIFSTNLFGHPSRLGMNEWDKGCGTYLIEDNAQSPFAMAHGRHCGTMGHIGVFSLNVHKHIQCGEGGVIVTNDVALAERMRRFINHGEHGGSSRIGLNLRMPELCAVVALTQMQRAPALIEQRQRQAQTILNEIGFIPGIQRPVVRTGCTHVYYTIPFLIDRARDKFCHVLREQGIPIVERYAMPLHRMPAFARWSSGSFPVADELYDKRLFYIENCAWTFNDKQIRQIGEAFRKAADVVKL